MAMAAMAMAAMAAEESEVAVTAMAMKAKEPMVIVLKEVVGAAAELVEMAMMGVTEPEASLVGGVTLRQAVPVGRMAVAATATETMREDRRDSSPSNHNRAQQADCKCRDS